MLTDFFEVLFNHSFAAFAFGALAFISALSLIVIYKLINVFNKEKP